MARRKKPNLTKAIADNLSTKVSNSLIAEEPINENILTLDSAITLVNLRVIAFTENVNNFVHEVDKLQEKINSVSNSMKENTSVLSKLIG